MAMGENRVERISFFGPHGSGDQGGKRLCFAINEKIATEQSLFHLLDQLINNLTFLTMLHWKKYAWLGIDLSSS